jgi:hypothetical protein
MGGIAATLEMYGRVFGRAGQLILRNWPVLGSVLVYGLLTTAAMVVGASLGAGLSIIGGLLANLVWAACVGSFLSLIETMIRSGRVSWPDFQRSFGTYLWDVVGVTFIVWVVFAIVAPAVRTLPQGPGILIAMNLLLFVLFNAVPELIYLGHHSSLEVLTESFTFISDNWIEWFPATLVPVFILFLILGLPIDGLFAWVKTAGLALIICVTMVARGLLFIELRGSSRRGRAFQRAAR